MPKKEFLNFEFEVKASEDEKGIIEGYGSVFGNVDFHNDVIEKGAFVKTLKKQLPAMLLQHNSNDVIGVWTLAKEDNNGLKLTGSLNMEVQKARESFHLAKQGALRGLSVGFYTKQEEMIKGVRHIKEVELLEVSLVTFPANNLARVSGVKSDDAPKTERELEAALRELGYGKKAAMAIISVGFKGFQAMQRDADDGMEKDKQRDADDNELKKILDQLDQIKQQLKG